MLKLEGASWLKYRIFAQDQGTPPKYLVIIKGNSKNSREST